MAELLLPKQLTRVRFPSPAPVAPFIIARRFLRIHAPCVHQFHSMSSAPVSRNDPCPCGSGRRYKHCCGATGISAIATSSGEGNESNLNANGLDHALALHQAGRIDEAERIYLALLDAQPASSTVLHYLGVCCYQRGNHELAAHYIRHAVSLNDEEAMAQNNLGLVFQALKQPADALACFNLALAQNPDDAVAFNNRGLVLHDLRRFDEAVADFTRATVLRADFAEAFTNLAKTLASQKRFPNTLAACDAALALQPRLATAHALRGSVLRDLRRYDEALASWARALALNPDFAEVHFNLGGALHELRRFEEAVASQIRALALKPNMPYLRGDLLHDRMQCCDWDSFASECAAILAAIDGNEIAAHPFAVLGLPATAEQQQRCARIQIKDMQAAAEPLWQGDRYSHERIRMAYVSADLRNHPVAHLIAGLFERHDRTKFEIIAISIGPPTTDIWRQRLERSVDQFFDVATQSDEDIARLMRTLEIDIAVDLMGHTGYARTGVFALRPAPLQVSYLGYPGTVGAAFIDYVIADATLIPETQQSFYDEKIVYMPHSYQMNDSSKNIAMAPTRAVASLPEHAFVFCCFNAAFKITPDVFDVWMRLLNKVAGSVLWLLDFSPVAVRNLTREAKIRGVVADRLIFAPKVALAEHLARHQCADLFLDTFHYNAHTTASDALWAGLPVLTCAGQTFASRVAASLLNAVGLPELITCDCNAYEAMAYELATHPERLAALRSRLAVNRLTQPLFDTEMSTRHLESAYCSLHARHQADGSPDHLFVAG